MHPDEMHPDRQYALREELRRVALEAGFAVARFARAAPPPGHEHLEPWLAAGRHGDMAFLARQPQRRCDPRLLEQKPATLLILGTGCAPAPSPAMAGYALGADYHVVLKERANRVQAWIETRLGLPLPGSPLVDSAPLLEKPLAASCGVGWQGKNTLLVSRRFGCRLLLAELPLPFVLPPDPPENNHCGDCTRCLDACPTAAFPAPFQLDARRCIAYLTIEHRGAIPLDLRPRMGERIFGCDACLAVCPFNRFPTGPVWEALRPLPRFHAPTLASLAFLSPREWRELSRETAMARTGPERLRRNLAVALGNGRHGENGAALHHLLHDESPLVREHAAWGLAQWRRNAG